MNVAENLADDHYAEEHHHHRPQTQDNNKRPRPMTSADYTLSDRNYGTTAEDYQTQDYATQENYPPIEGGQARAFSGKPGKRTRKTKLSNAAKYKQIIDGNGQTTFTIKNNRLVHNPSADFGKLKPKKIAQEKERLYEEALHLKTALNTVNLENVKLKTKIGGLEREASKLERMIQETNVNAYKEGLPTKGAENYLTIRLKQEVKDLKMTLLSRDEELAEIKKSMKHTKIQELEMQLKAFQEEAARLRSVMDFIIKEKANVVMSSDEKDRFQEDHFLQLSQLKLLKRDNEEMATAIKILEEQNFEYEKKLSEHERKTKREITQYKKALNEKEKEMMRIRNDIGLMMPSSTTSQSGSGKRPMTGITRDDIVRQELEKKTTENSNLINQLAEKRNLVLTLERQIRDLRSEINEKGTNAQNEKQALMRELEKLRNAKASGLGDSNKSLNNSEIKATQELKLDDYVKRASIQRSFSQEEKDKILLYNQAMRGVHDKKHQKGVPKKRLQKVRPEDVYDIGYELNLRFKIKRLTFADIDKSIWPDKVRKTNIISLKEMIDVLKNEPFNMANEEDAVITARYLIEDNENEYVFYDENIKSDLTIVKSILKKLIGNLPTWDEAEIRSLHNELTDICIKNYGGLRENLKVLCKTGFLSAKDIRQACNLIDVPITDHQIEYMIQKMFEVTDNIHKLPIDTLFEAFSESAREKLFEENASLQGKDEDRSPLTAKLNEHISHHSIREAQKEEDEEDNLDEDSEDDSQGSQKQ